MNIKPSQIYYSQDSISNTFNNYGYGKTIGETLDEICEERCSIEEIPIITVIKQGNKWISLDNRRLWIFKHLERHGKCKQIPVNVESGWGKITDRRLTSQNGGKEVKVRGDPGGKWHSSGNGFGGVFTAVLIGGAILFARAVLRV